VNIQDSIKSVVVAGITAVLTTLNTIVQSGKFPTAEDFKSLVSIAILAGVGTLITKALTNSKGVLISLEDK
jgi:uncharacterized membrane protein